MRSITLNADESLLKAAEERARAQDTTVEALFQQWLAEYAREPRRSDRAMALLEELRRKGVSTGGRKFTRDEMNER